MDFLKNTARERFSTNIVLPEGKSDFFFVHDAFPDAPASRPRVERTDEALEVEPEAVAFDAVVVVAAVDNLKTVNYSDLVLHLAGNAASAAYLLDAAAVYIAQKVDEKEFVVADLAVEHPDVVGWADHNAVLAAVDVVGEILGTVVVVFCSLDAQGLAPHHSPLKYSNIIINIPHIQYIFIQGDQLNMAVFFWYLGKSDLSSVHVYSIVQWTTQLL